MSLGIRRISTQLEVLVPALRILTRLGPLKNGVRADESLDPVFCPTLPDGLVDIANPESNKTKNQGREN